MTTGFKTRKVELIIYGYGRRTMFTLKSFDMDFPKIPYDSSSIGFDGKIEKVECIKGKEPRYNKNVPKQINNK